MTELTARAEQAATDAAGLTAMTGEPDQATESIDARDQRLCGLELQARAVLLTSQRADDAGRRAALLGAPAGGGLTASDGEPPR